MIRTPVTSSNVVSIGWEADTLEVEFKSAVYSYAGVPRSVYEAALASASVGKFINASVVGTYPFVKL